MGGQLSLAVDVTNTGNVAGNELVQLHVGYPNTETRRPPKELKAFERVALEPNETETVLLEVPANRLGYWHSDADAWVVEQVEQTVFVGSGSEPDSLLSESFTLVP